MSRPSGRFANELRAISLETDVITHAEGSCLVRFGNTHVLCTASVEESIPGFLRGKGRGWVTAEYGMLPRSTHQRMRREASVGKQGGRTQEIQRLIGRALRSAVDLEALGERQITVDCDVIQADGGTRTASITGGFVALYQATQRLAKAGLLSKPPIRMGLAAVSCGIHEGEAILDLDYEEDSAAEVDANFVMNSQGNLVEIQGTAETNPFTEQQLSAMLVLARQGIQTLIEAQRTALRVTFV